jgi:hypothetical protein
MASLVFQAFGVPITAVESMIATIENMKFFLQTGYGDSMSFAGGGLSIKTQGMCQGNGASLAAWAVISICILKAHDRKGHSTKFVCPITKLEKHLLAILHVDDTDLLHIDLTKNETINKVHMAIQESVNSWGNLLIATGGALQLSKCFYSIISFDWINCAWKYASNTQKGEFGVTIPLPGGRKAGIGHRLVRHAKKTLGAMTSLDRNSWASIVMMQEKAQQWVNNVRNRHLHQCNVWFLLKIQLWPRIGYSICSSTATFKELSKALHQ